MAPSKCLELDCDEMQFFTFVFLSTISIVDRTFTAEMSVPLITQGFPAPSIRPSSIDQYTASTDLYPVARGVFGKDAISYLLQGSNGPCPLLAISNVLLLRRDMQLSEESVDVTCETLMDVLTKALTKLNDPPSGNDALQVAVEGALSSLGGLNKGLNVNIRFTSVDGFEHTKEMSIFDVLNVHVYHGWIVSEDDMTAFPYVSPLTYNEASEKIIICEEIKCKVLESGNFDSASDKRALLEEGEAIAQWMEQTSNQLTSDGIIQLNSRLTDVDLSVLFRNNHFIVIHKRDGRLFALVTDIGFRGTGIMWESLDQLDGDTLYLDSSFKPISSGRSHASVDETDYQMALRLQFGAGVGDRTPPLPAAVRPAVPKKKRKTKCSIM